MTDVLEVRYSDDEGDNYTMPRLVPLGAVGEHPQKVVRRMGITRGRQYEFRYSGDRRCDLIAVSVDVQG